MKHLVVMALLAVSALTAGPVQAQRWDPYCALEPTVACLLDIVSTGLDDMRPGYGKDSVLSDYGRALALTGKLAGPEYDWYTNYGDFRGTNANNQGLQPPLRMRWARRLEGTGQDPHLC